MKEFMIAQNKQKIKTIMIVCSASKSLIGFRGDLIRSWIALGHTVYAVGPEDFVQQELLDMGVKRFFFVPMQRTGNNPLGDFNYCRRLYAIMKEINPDLTLAYTIKPVIYTALAAKMAGVKSVNSLITGAGFIFASKSLKSKVLGIVAKFLYRIGLMFSERVIFQNKDDLAEFCDKGLVKKSKCYLVNGSGVNMDQFAPAPFPERISFLMVSRLLYSKGVLEYFEAAQRVKIIYPNIRFMMLGAIDNQADCIPREEVQSYFDSGVIDYLGTSSDVPSIIAQSSVMILPSYREGVPRSVLEAMAMARPILTTDVPGCRETVIDGKNGFLVQSKNIEELYLKMCWYIENQDKIKQMGRNSLDLCRDKFEVSKVNQSMNEILGVIN